MYIKKGLQSDVLNVHVPNEEKSGDSKDSCYVEPKHAFDQFPKYHMKTVLGDCNAKVRQESIFKSEFGNESSHEISSDKGVRVVNFTISEN